MQLYFNLQTDNNVTSSSRFIILSLAIDKSDILDISDVITTGGFTLNSLL